MTATHLRGNPGTPGMPGVPGTVWAARAARWIAGRPHALNTVIALGCLAVATPVTMFIAYRHHAHVLAAAVVAAVSSLLLLLSQRRPREAVVGTAAGAALLIAMVPDMPPPTATVMALFLLAARTDRRTALLTSTAVGTVLTTTAFILRPELSALGSNLAILAWTQLPSALGDAFRSRRELLATYQERAEHAEATREEEARRRVAAERLRIARELHDVVTHHLTLVNAQAGVAHHLVRNHPAQAHDALGQIRDTSRAALDELRATVGLLREPEDSAQQHRSPAPGLHDLPAALTAFRHAGLSVDLHCPTPIEDIPPLTDLTAYRILQEALTNAGKHTSHARVRAEITTRPGILEVTVVDDGGRRPHPPGPGTGMGLINLRERARAVGGTLVTAADPGGGFRVHAVLPLPLPAASRRTPAPQDAT